MAFGGLSGMFSSLFGGSSSSNSLSSLNSSSSASSPKEEEYSIASAQAAADAEVGFEDGVEVELSPEAQAEG